MIESGKVVQLTYRLTDSEGQVLDEATSQDPFVYMHGSAQIIPGLESALQGLETGDKKQVEIKPADAYGDVNPELRMSVTRSQFPEGVDIQPGMQFEARSPEGQGVMFRVEAVEGDQVQIDGNHPLAGRTLHFDVEVLTIREATEEEKAHGHAHGPDGTHQH